MEHVANINIGGERHEAHSENTTVYRHLGKAAIYDHIFISIGEDAGIYIWNDNPQFNELGTRAVEAACLLILNIKEASETDVKAYIEHHSKDLDSFNEVPDDWK